ncbi:MAG TPA: hypothetical protein VI911_11155 [Patescibacteria group bacterium]|nr:hypothetical protein [Patescibacteria group bacterium]
MSYLYWPSGLAPYTAYTHITDRTTQLNHQSIMDGLARDIGWLQHNINATNLFASGYVTPILSGFFRNIDTNYLYVDSVQVRTLYLYNIMNPNMPDIDILGTNLNVVDAAFRNNNLTVLNSFRGLEEFSLNSSGFIYNPPSISGGIYDFYLARNGNSKLLGGSVGNFILNSGNINVDSNHRIIIENLGSFSPSGSISESGIYWNSITGHDHRDNKIKASTIIATDLTYNTDVEIITDEGFIEVTSGVLDANKYFLEVYYDSIGFHEVDYSVSGVYICDIPALTGNVSELDIGTCPMISYNGKVYAASLATPTGSINLSDTYIYSSEDFYTWSGVLVSGDYRPIVSGIATVDGFAINSNVLYFLWNLQVSSGNYCDARSIDNISSATPIKYHISGFAHGSSRYGLGISSVENAILLYGYEYPHIYESGIPKWDNHTILYNYDLDRYESYQTSNEHQHISFSGVPYKYSFPFIQGFDMSSFDSSLFWLDGTYSGGIREPYYTDAQNDGVFKNLVAPSNTFSGYFGAFFGNGFSEISSILLTELSYHNGQRGLNTVYINSASAKQMYGDIIENFSESPLLIFGNSTIACNTTSSGTIFGGCIPLVMDIDKRLLYNIGISGILITSQNVDYSPNILRGSKSLLDTSILFRINAYLYFPGVITGVGSLMVSNLFNYELGEARLWTDYRWVSGQRTELINLCPWDPGLLTVPFGGASGLYYKHEHDVTTSKINYTSMLVESSGIIIPSSTFVHPGNFPTFYDRPTKDGFWSTKTFDWYYIPQSDYFGPPNRAYTKTYHYMRPRCPVQHNGVVYSILEFNTGFNYIGPDGSEYIDDDILYSDLIKYGNAVYGVGVKVILDDRGNYNYSLVLSTIKRNVSTQVPLSQGISGDKQTPKFLIHKGLLYIGIGNGRFLVKKPSHIDLCITSNL